MLCDETVIKVWTSGWYCLIKDVTVTLVNLKCFVAEKMGIFVNFNTDSRISLCSRALILMYVVGQYRGYRIALSDFKIWLLTRLKNNTFIECNVPLLYNAVLIYATKELDCDI